MKVSMLMMAGLVGCGLAVTALAQAQTTPVKPAAKTAAKPAGTAAPTKAPVNPAAEGKTVAIGNGTGSGPVLTREELRACLKQEADVRSRLPESDARRVALDKERAGFSAEQEALKADRAALADTRDVEALRARIAAFTTKADDVNKRVAEFELAQRTGPQAERLKSLLARERLELDAERKALEADAETTNAAGKDRIAAFNTRVAAIDARVADWNVRNNQLNKDAQALEDDRLAWIDACQNRRYREDDETAIRSGK